MKLQWKPDFGARWAALDVDFEMYGKDHSTNTPIYDGICEILGGRAPEHFTYELFLDEKGEKISKSKGNGLTIDEWLTLRRAGEPRLFHVRQAEDGEAAAISTSSRRTSTNTTSSCAPSRGRTRGRGWPTRSGTSTAASRRRATCW